MAKSCAGDVAVLVCGCTAGAIIYGVLFQLLAGKQRDISLQSASTTSHRSLINFGLRGMSHVESLHIRVCLCLFRPP